MITVGVNRYFTKHALKWTTDVGFALDEISSDRATTPHSSTNGYASSSSTQ